MEKRESRLHQSGHPSRRHGVADHRLHRTDHRRTGFGRWSENLPQGRQLGLVAGPGGGAMCLDQAHRTGRQRIQSGGSPGLSYGSNLTTRIRAGKARRPAIAGHRAAADHRVNPVAVALGVGQPFQHHHPGALTDQDAIGAAVERPDLFGRRQRAELAENTPESDVVAVVDPTGQHHVTAPGRQLTHRLIDRDQRGGAGSVHCVRRTAQIQPVRYPRSGQVGHQANGPVRMGRAYRIGESGANFR